MKKESRQLGFMFYEALYGPIVFVRSTYRELVVLFAMFFGGAAIFTYYDKVSLLVAFLGSVSTITTIGLYLPNNGNFTTMDRNEAILLIVVMIVAVGAGASMVQKTVSTVVNGELAKGEAEKRLINRLKRHVIVFGYSHLGRYVVEKLEELGFDYVVLTKDPVTYQQLLSKDIFAVLEYETQPITALSAAGIERAAMVVVAHENDPDNMLVILSARKLRPDIRIISVVHDQALIETARNAGADMVIPSSVTVGHLLALSAVTKNLVGVVFSEKIGTKEIAQFSVFKSSPLIGKGLAEVSKYSTVIGVVRNDQVLKNTYDPAFRIEEGDTILVLGAPDDLLQLEERARAL
ncbi:MAG TPA: NAD-binding protein [Nitrososphaerales archaeon]|nr:NAD-binding protein [Nitrososphaerales archaeon]